ncbi:MAG: hypothetical protein LQ347_006320 [Umbilicaria vellea]|nr:MAG: hypothetical protein LQ347_006320 [Umbilicaria vellea]
MVHLTSVLKAIILLLAVTVPAALADTLNRTMCYCGTPSGQLDVMVEAGCYYFFQYHSNPYNLELGLDYTCRSPNYDNVCTKRRSQKQKRCRSFNEGWEFCYVQHGGGLDRYSFQGIRHGIGGLIVTPPQAEIDMICDRMCLKHVGLPRIPKPWDITNLVGHVREWRGENKVEIFPELPDIVLPHRGFPAMGPGSDDE